MAEAIKIVVLEGDQTGQELLEQSLRVLDPALLGLDLALQRFDLSLEHRRATSNGVVDDAAVAMREAGLGLKAATITPEGAGDVGSPEPHPARGGGRQGDRPHRAPAARGGADRRRPPSHLGRADGGRGRLRGQEWREGDAGVRREVAYRTEKITRSTCRAVAEFAFRTAAKMGARVYGGPKWTVSPVYEGMLKEEMDAAAARHPEIPYQPVLIDATYAGLLSGATDAPLVIPALNRDGDCLSDLVLPMFGSIAGAESVLLAFDEEITRRPCAMAEAPHGTAPALLGKDLANPLAMILACGALLRHAADRHGPAAERASRAIYEGALETIASGSKTPDLGGNAGTTEFTTEVVSRVATKIEVWSSLGSAA